MPHGFPKTTDAPASRALMNYKLLRGASILVPVLFTVFALGSFLLYRKTGAGEQFSKETIPLLALLVVATFLSVISLCFFIVFDIIHVVKRRSLTAAEKIGWICAIAFPLLNVITIPIFGFIFYNEDRKSDHSQG